MINMTKQDLEILLAQMDDLVVTLQGMGKTESARLLQNAIDEIDYDLEGVDLK